MSIAEAVIRLQYAMAGFLTGVLAGVSVRARWAKSHLRKPLSRESEDR